MKRFVFSLVCAVMLVVGFASCNMDANLSEEVLSITLSDGEWKMRMTQFWNESWYKDKGGVGPACDIPEYIQKLVIADLKSSEADSSYKDSGWEYQYEFYIYSNIDEPLHGSRRQLYNKKVIRSELNTCEESGNEEYINCKNLYEKNKEEYKEQYKQFRKQWEEQELSCEWRTQYNYNLEFFFDSGKCKVTSSERTITTEVKGDISFFEAYRNELSKSKNSDGTYSCTESYSGFTGNDILEIIIARIELMDSSHYTIKTNKKRTKYKAEFDKTSKYETIYLEKK